jgi:hypothetical protein
MKHLLMDPAYPDIVGEWAAAQVEEQRDDRRCANDNIEEVENVLPQPLLTLLARLDVAATRLW